MRSVSKWDHSTSRLSTITPPERERSFLDWLRHAGDRAGRIVINGDLFDFWFEFRGGIPRGHAPVLDALGGIAASGVPVILMGGNHDWWGGSFLREEVGVEFLQEPVVRELAGRSCLLAHGDGLGDGDRAYRLIRRALRARLPRWLFGWLPPEMGSAVARRVSGTEKRGGEPSEAL
ncbi:MAG: UDP-2,3-diacylglucosamine diphosphatase, partial [Thermoanaerobaculia bacterium]|nr:UDP-2,3-diacylglucosamine diphosphatase [Thermoanaerobaculia bacterium]